MTAQDMLDAMGVNVGATIPLPYGLMLEITVPNNLNELCETPEELQAVEGLLSVCQGVLFTLSEVSLLELASLIMIVNPELGIIMSIRDRGIVQMLTQINPNASIEDVLNEFLLESGIIEEMNKQFDEVQVQYLPFEELVPLWWRIVNSRMVYVLRVRYHTTNYSMITGLDSAAMDFFGH